MGLPNYTNSDIYTNNKYLKVNRRKKDIKDNLVSIEVKNRNFKAKLIAVSIALILICSCIIFIEINK